MGRKKIIFFLCAFLSQSCATKKQPSPILTKPAVSDTKPSPQDLPAPDLQTSEEQKIPKRIAVWIDSAGVDAFAALGFLQELEKSGHSPVKIVGTGMGCWIASAWALENNGNRAEWQAFKLDSLEEVKSSFVQKLVVSRNQKDEFVSRLEKMGVPSSFSRHNLPIDCPILEAQNPWRLLSSRNESVSETLWRQVQLPLWGNANLSAKERMLSGAFLGQILPQDFTQMSVGTVPEIDMWIVLKTKKTSDLRFSPEQILTSAMHSRLEKSFPMQGEYALNRQWIVVSMNPPVVETSFADKTQFSERRRWMLWGREIAKKFLEQQSF